MITRLVGSWLLALTLLGSSGCRSGQPDGEDHAHDHGHAHAGDHADAWPSRSVTRHGRHFELFAEHPLLVAGRPAQVAAHFTVLRDWSALREGQVEAVLRGPDGQEKPFAVDVPARPGIFQPELRPESPGAQRLLFRVRGQGLSETIDAGPVTVHPNEEAAREAPSEAEPPQDAVPFLKEQQWKVTFATGAVQEGALEAGLDLPGTVRPAAGKEVVIAAPAAGRVAMRGGSRPRLGATVRAGEVLAVLTPSELFASQDRAGLQAAVRTADAEAAQARRELARAERLLAAEAVPLRRVEEARTALVVAEAQRQAAQDHLREKLATLSGAAGVSVESYELRAPIAGTVVDVRLVPGAFVEAGQELLHLVDLRTVWIEARVPEGDLAAVAQSKRAELAVAGGAPVLLDGALVTVGGVLDPATRTAPAVFALPNPQGLHRIGMTARVRALRGLTPRGPVIPRSAVVDDNGRPVVYVQLGGETFERRPVALGVTSGARVQVVSGLKAGERVVTEGGYEIRLASLSNAVPAHGHEH